VASPNPNGGSDELWWVPFAVSPLVALAVALVVYLQRLTGRSQPAADDPLSVAELLDNHDDPDEGSPGRASRHPPVDGLG
jgi:hypothetical protein